MQNNYDYDSLMKKSVKADALKSRIGMLYALFSAPALGIALGLLGTLSGNEPFSSQIPAGGLAAAVFLQYPFALVAMTLFAFISGTYRDIFSIFNSKISWWTLFAGVGGFLGDVSFTTASILLGSSLSGPIAMLYCLVTAFLSTRLLKENTKRKSTIIALILIAVGMIIVMNGGQAIAPSTGIYFIIGVVVMIFGSCLWGMESLVLAAGSDLIRSETFLWFRLSLAFAVAAILFYIGFPEARPMLGEVYSDPKMIAFGAIIGFAWIIWLLLGYYYGVAYAGGTRGVAINIIGFFFISIFSMTVYGGSFSGIVVVGAVVICFGSALMILEPSDVLSKRRE